MRIKNLDDVTCRQFSFSSQIIFCKSRLPVIWYLVKFLSASRSSVDVSFSAFSCRICRTESSFGFTWSKPTRCRFLFYVDLEPETLFDKNSIRCCVRNELGNIPGWYSGISGSGEIILRDVKGVVGSNKSGFIYFFFIFQGYTGWQLLKCWIHN